MFHRFHIAGLLRNFFSKKVVGSSWIHPSTIKDMIFLKTKVKTKKKQVLPSRFDSFGPSLALRELKFSGSPLDMSINFSESFDNFVGRNLERFSNYQGLHLSPLIGGSAIISILSSLGKLINTFQYPNACSASQC